MSCCKLCRAVAAVLAVVSIQACGPGISLTPLPPTFLEIVNEGGMRTGFRPDTENSTFTFFNHTDVFNDNACGDLAVAPDGIMRSLAVIRPDGTPRGRELVIRTGLGPSNWSNTFTTAVIPDTAFGLGNVPQCTPLRMIRMRDNLHAIFWINTNTDSLFTAVYSADNPQTLKFGRSIRQQTGMESASRLSPAFFRNEVHVTWSDVPNARINTLRGSFNADGVVVLGGPLLFTEVAHAEISDAVVLNDTMFLAVRTAAAVELRRKALSALPFTVVASCPNPRPFRGRLLFRDAAGDFWVTETAPQNSTNVRLRSFTDCSTREIVHPLGIGQMYYHPGRP